MLARSSTRQHQDRYVSPQLFDGPQLQALASNLNPCPQVPALPTMGRSEFEFSETWQIAGSKNSLVPGMCLKAACWLDLSEIIKPVC